MNKKISLGAALSMLVLVAAASIFITMTVAMKLYTGGSSSNTTQNISKINEIDTVVRENYVGAIDEEALTEGIASGYFYGLGDAHSYYLTADDYSRNVLRRTGKSTIGVMLSKQANDRLYVYYVMPNSPAEKAGLTKGCIITSINGKTVKELGVDEAVDLMSSAEQSINLEYVTNSGDQATAKITPEEFQSTTIEAKIIGSIGYIKIFSFVETTDEQFIDAVDTMIKQNVTGIVFDVRHNGGGTLSSVVAAIDRICPEGDIVSKVDKDGNKTVLHVSDANEVNLPMVVLVDGDTASASELFACALRDYEKAELVGTQTYGKGSMQELFPFKDGSAINLTTSYFNPPKSENFNGVGLTPDYEVALDADFYSVSEENDTQLQYAIGLLQK